MSSAIHITHASFAAEVLSAPGLVITDFWAEWSMPCKRIAPILEELATQYAGKVKVVKLDVENNPITPEKYNITSIPTLLVFKDGKLADTIVGFLPKDRLFGRLKPHF